MCLSGLANLRHYLCDNAKSDSIAALSRGGSNARLRFYALDGFAPAEDEGWGMSYNFGSREAVILRWKAAIFAGELYPNEPVRGVGSLSEAGCEGTSPLGSSPHPAGSFLLATWACMT